jgi:hypothetical protein
MHFWKVFAGYRFAVVMMRITAMTEEMGLVPPGASIPHAQNNGVTRVLASLLDLPSPGEPVEPGSY